MSWQLDPSSSTEPVPHVLGRVREVVSTHHLCVVATLGASGARLTPCFYAPFDDTSLVIVSSRHSRHATTWEADPRFTALIAVSPPQGGRFVSLHLSGDVVRPTGMTRVRAVGAYAAHMSGQALRTGAAGTSDLFGKTVFVLRPVGIELLDTDVSSSPVRLGRHVTAA